jgi:hypothetical protein
MRMPGHDPRHEKEHELADPLAALGALHVPRVPRVERLGGVRSEDGHHRNDAERVDLEGARGRTLAPRLGRVQVVNERRHRPSTCARISCSRTP